MKIAKVRIRNFRSIKDETLVFPENGVVALIGANNAGKSNFLRAIDLVLGDQWATEGRLEDYYFYCGDRDNEICIEIFFDDQQIEKFVFGKNGADYKLQMKYRSTDKLYFLSNEVKDRFPCTYLSAERNIAKDISFNKWSLMGKVSKSFNSNFKQSGKEQELQEHFKKVKELFDSIDNFKCFQDDFKKFFAEMQSDSPYKLKVDFKPFTPNNYFKTINILASDPSFSEADFDLEELGDGAKNLVILALLRSYAKNFRDASGILALEEPEIYLHPQARRHLFQTLKKISEDSEGKIQIIYTTHDSAFLELSSFESIRRVYKVDDEDGETRKHTQLKGVTCEELIRFGENTGVPAGNTKDKLLEFYRSLSNYRLNEGFFSRLIILAEGATEELALPVYLDSCGINCDALGISVLGVGGKGEIPKYWRLFSKFDIPTIIVFDNDASDTDSKRNNSVLATCFNTTAEVIESSIPVFTHQIFSNSGIFENQDVIILEEDFETAIKKDIASQSIDLSVIEEEGKRIIAPKGKPKQVLARWIAMQLKEKHPNYTPSFVSKIKELIEVKTGRIHAE